MTEDESGRERSMVPEEKDAVGPVDGIEAVAVADQRISIPITPVTPSRICDVCRNKLAAGLLPVAVDALTLKGCGHVVVDDPSAHEG